MSGNGYVSIFDRLSTTETRSTAMKKAGNRDSYGDSISYMSTSRSIRSSTSRTSRYSTMSTRTAPPSSSFFDRLAYTETFASASKKGKLKESVPNQSTRGRTAPNRRSKGSTDDAFFNRMASTETFSTARMKANSNESSENRTVGSRKKFASSGTKSRKTSGSFFDRMASSDTVATAGLKKGKKDSKSNQGGRVSRRTLAHKVTSISFFDRLSKKDTQSSSSRKKKSSNDSNPRPSSARPKSAKSTTSQSSRSSLKQLFEGRSDEKKESLGRKAFFQRKNSVSKSNENSSSNSSSFRKLFHTRSIRPSTADNSKKPRESLQSSTRPNSASFRKRKPIQKPRDPPPILNFSEDDLSFGDETEEEEEIELNANSGKDSSQSLQTGNVVNEEKKIIFPSQQDVLSTEALLSNGASHSNENNPPAQDNNSFLLSTSNFSATKASTSEEVVAEGGAEDVPAPQDNPASERDELGESYLSFGSDDDGEHSLEEILEDEEDHNYDDALPVVMEEPQNEASLEDPTEVLDQSDHNETAVEEKKDVDEPKMTRYKILCSDKYQPENGLQELDPVALNLVDSLITFESNGFTMERISVLIIEALFQRDFKDRDHWDVDPGTARELEEDEGGGGDLEGRAFVVKQQARWDSEKSYSVAAAKGTVTIWPETDEIRMENYSYFVA